MEIASTSKLYTQTKCRVVDINDMRLGFEPSDPMRSAIAFLPEGTRIQPNFYGDKNAPKKGTYYFLMDHKEVVKMKSVYAKCTTEAEKNQKTDEYLGSMTKFSTYFKKTIYLRLIGPSALNGREPRLFLAEVLETIPIALRQQKTPIQRNNNQLEMLYHQMSMLQTTHGQNSITLGHFEFLLDQYDIDKTKITLIPDLSQEAVRRMYIERGGMIRLFSPNMRPVIDCVQAVMNIFTKVVWGVNWKVEKCTEHEGCNQKIKECILGWLDRFVRHEEQFYCDANYTDGAIYAIRGECDFKYNTKRNAPNHFMPELGAEDETFISNYHAVVKYYNLPKYPIFLTTSRRDTMYVWMLRFLCHLGWIQTFYTYDPSIMDASDQKGNAIVIECLFFMVPAKHLTVVREFVKTVLLGGSSTSGSSEHEESVDDASVEELTDMMKDGIKIHDKKGRHPKPKNKKKKKK